MISFLNPSEQDNGPHSADLLERVQKARGIQQTRFAGVPYINSNAQMNEAMIKEFCSLDSESIQLLSLAFEKFQLSFVDLLYPQYVNNFPYQPAVYPVY
ncbi:MAG: magnesium chelatase subunit ChlI family protein [Desulfitobacteriaceae bacterium]